MKKLVLSLVFPMVLALSGAAFAKIPPPPPLDAKAAEEKAAKDKIAADKAKADADLAKAQQTAAEDKAVKNFQANMKKAGKPVPKPTPVVVAAAPAPAGAKAAEKPAAKDDKAKAKK